MLLTAFLEFSFPFLVKHAPLYPLIATLGKDLLPKVLQRGKDTLAAVPRVPSALVARHNSHLPAAMSYHQPWVNTIVRPRVAKAKPAMGDI